MFDRYGIPREIVTDVDARYIGNKIKELLKKCYVWNYVTSPYD